jgi:hypothetical protein
MQRVSECESVVFYGAAAQKESLLKEAPPTQRQEARKKGFFLLKA